MILRFEVNEIRNVFGCGALSVARITQTRACRAYRFVFAGEPVAIECSNFEVIEKQSGAVVFLPLPVFERSYCSVEPKLLFGVRAIVASCSGNGAV